MKSFKHFGLNTFSSTLLIALITMLVGCKNLPITGTTASTNNTAFIKNTPESQPKVTPPPVTARNIHEANPVEAIPFWEDLSAGFSLDLSSNNARTVAQRNWYASHPEYIRRVVKRAEPYIYYIYQQAKHRNIPAELVLLPIVESAFDPFAYSHGRASGIWQFIPGTGKAYGLKQTWWYDGRRDVKASTDAAFNYLTKLSAQFDGDWLLALAAYNSGGGTVRKSVRYNKKHGRPTDFWSLKLPKETRAYVPKLIAIAQIFKTPEKYGITLPLIANAPQVAIAYTGSQIDMAQAATLANVSIDELYTLNPGFNRWATDPEGPHSLLLPIEKAEAFTIGLSKLPKEERVTWSRYKIKSGDSLISIARANKTTPAMIRDVNHIQGNRIVAGKTILIPSAAQSSKAYRLALDQRMKAKTNRAVKGKRRVHHYVQPGDSFWKIAKRYKVKTRSLAKWNGMAPTDPLVSGKKLTIWVANKSPTGRKSGKIRKVNYKARNGDSYARIADKFNVSVNEIKRWNKVDLKRYLQPGQLVTLYVDITNAP